MNSRIFNIMATVLCSYMIVGCAIPPARVAIINPILIDQKEAKEKLISRYSNTVVKADRLGFEGATAICRRIQTGEIRLEGIKSSKTGRYVVFMFKENEDNSGALKGHHTIIAFYFTPGSELIRACNESRLCDVYVRNGFIRFGSSNINVYGEPTVADDGINIKFNEDRYFAYDLLFSYADDNKQEGNELIAIFLSAFPFLDYQ